MTFSDLISRFTLFWSVILDGLQRFTSIIKEDKRYSLFEVCEPLWIVAKPPEDIYSANNIKDRSRKSVFYGWQLFPRTVALSAIACVIRDFCYWVQSLGLLSAKLLRQISRIKIYTDINLGLYFGVFSCKHDLFFSNVCRLNFCLMRPLHIAAN